MAESVRTTIDKHSSSDCKKGACLVHAPALTETIHAAE